MPKKTAVLIVAAGSGERVGGDIPKQYQMVNGKTLLERSITRFSEHPEIEHIFVVIKPEHLPLYSQIPVTKQLPAPIPGGNVRQDSVRLGLNAIAELNPDIVLIHDAARIFPSKELISRVIHTALKSGAAIPVLPLTDTVKQVSDSVIKATLDRSELVGVQTPQGFAFSDILGLHNRFAGDSLSDDASLFEKAGHTVHTVAGEDSNFKITTPNDLKRAENMLNKEMETRVGIGFDTHKLIEHDSTTIKGKGVVKLCGVSVPHDKRLEGHSDADVGYHALVDAILGALGAGDIGIHFPPTDPQWRGADSSRFVLYAQQLVHKRNATIVNVDMTFICERPKISPYHSAMIENISHLMNLDKSRINIKATTTERMGFTGRGEGIAAQAIASLKVPQ